jgi:hypothetical protein
VSDDDEDEDIIGEASTKKWVRPKALTTNVSAHQSYLFTNSGNNILFISNYYYYKNIYKIN